MNSSLNPLSNPSSYAHWVKNEMNIEIDPRLTIFEHSCSTPDQIERGIQALTDIPAETTLAIVRFNSLLCVESNVEDESLRILQSELREDDALSLLLLYECSLGTSSKWYKHIQVIPEQYHSVVNYSEDELEYLKGSNLYELTKRWKVQIRNDYDEILQVLNKYNIDQTKLFGGELAFDRYVWALCSIWSRCITAVRRGKSLRCFVPFIDLLNHRPGAQVGHAFNENTDCLHLYSAQSFGAGQEIYLSYGSCSNSRLLMLYGFALPGNSDDSVELWGNMAETTSDYNLKLALLKRNKIHFDQEPFVLTAQSICDRLLTFLRVQYSNNRSVLKLLADDTSYKKIFQPLSDEEDEALVVRAAIEAIQAVLDKYPTTLAQDLVQLQQLQQAGVSFNHPKQRKLHALLVVSGEKRVLQSNIRRLQNLLPKKSS
jgi:hypothetical protein